MRSDVRDYELIAPTSLEAVLRLLADEPGVFTPIAGGTELMVALGAGRLVARKLVSLGSCGELRFIEVGEETVTIGSGTTFTDLRLHPKLGIIVPLLSQAASWIGGIANQNRGTIGGNLANASPAADSSPALLVYDAELDLISAAGTRRLPYRDFHLGYKKTALRSDELIHSVIMKIPRGRSTGPGSPGAVSYLRKVGTRNAMAVSKVVLAGITQVAEGVIQSLRLAGASVGETPMRLVKTEQALVGQQVTEAVVSAACDALQSEIRPIDDIRSTSKYRSAVAANLLREFLSKL